MLSLSFVTPWMWYEFIANAMHGLDVHRVRRIRFELGAQTGDMVVHRTSDRIGIESPDLVQQFVASNNSVFARREESQEIELSSRHLDRFSAPERHVFSEIDFDVPEFERLRKA